MLKQRWIVYVSILAFIGGCANTIPPGYPYDELSGNLKYEDVITVEGKSADELYSTIKKWVALNYNSANDVIQLDDNTNHNMVVKGNFQTGLMGKSGWYPHIMDIATKDGRLKYRISVSSYYSSGSGDVAFSGPMFSKQTIFHDADQTVKKTIASLNKFLIGELAKENDEW